MTQLTATPASPKKRRLIQNIAGPETFNLAALGLSSLVFSLGKLTVYAADQSQFLVYSLGALAISQCLVVAPAWNNGIGLQSLKPTKRP